MKVKNENEGKKDESGISQGAALDNEDLWGSDMYPERRGRKFQHSWFKYLLGAEGRESLDKNRCENNVYKCIKESPIIKLMMGALRSSGCEVDIRRHISCEVCNPIVTGGYDSEFNQIVICQNSAYNENMVRAVLLHEMIHMFDYCRNKLDVKNIDHLACTEIRAANLGHCSFMSSLLQGDSSFINIKATHQNCVKHKALLSVMAVHKVSKEVAEAAIERVFTKCYNDLEPIGRRIRRNSFDMPRAYAEGHLYGYDV
ncbi:Mitochondrial inner membrane protease ATP23 like protein [Trachymyrmex septentrionalis]|uniref:Mitochondrial inner membrane protease ATP23 n=1 Tax=Trachymyrmex septentrionalis TaxID=34720 RepID=A0A195ESZ1_9HYME|nr:PREDICTED: mitochondrial inner membrane protease ATP23 homolog isoform X2 [Trachymyrmex septentrionalis]KYN31370.1 Mitochondrial inner membrane protease ATP23 like protein [Trachymyrmex septentrionalis]